jgi:hypothetical protein
MMAAAFWVMAGHEAMACSGGSQARANLRAGRVLKPVTHTDAVEAHDAAVPSIAGFWHSQYAIGGQVGDESFESYFADGTEMEVDQSNPATDNVCSGVWVQTGAYTYKLTHPSWNFDTNGNLIGTVIIRDSVTLSKDGNSFRGTETVDVFDNNGKVVEHIDATVSSVRVKPL